MEKNRRRSIHLIAHGAGAVIYLLSCLVLWQMSQRVGIQCNALPSIIGKLLSLRVLLPWLAIVPVGMSMVFLFRKDIGQTVFGVSVFLAGANYLTAGLLVYGAMRPAFDCGWGVPLPG